MQIFKKEKLGTKRFINFCGIKFQYDTAKKFTYKEVNECGIIESNRKEKIIVSLTSFPARIPTIHITLSSIMQQSLKPDKIILWLAKEQFPNLEEDLPQSLLRLKEFGLTIKWYHDIRSYKKLIPTILEYPDDIIITVDDDVVYDEKMVENLYKSYLKNPNYINCHRITKISLKNGKLKAKPKKCYPKPSYANKLVGVGGVLYPPHSLHKDITDENLFMQLAPTNDDIWFWLMAVLNNTKVIQIKHNNQNPIEIPETLNGPCLCQVNDNGENLFYIQLENIFKHYKNLKEKVLNDMK